MIDYFKINNLLIGLEIQALIDFEIKVNENTGEQYLHKKKSANLNNLIFTITPGNRFVKVQGSLHKFANNGTRNNDRFTFDRFTEVAEQLEKYINPDDLINVLEFGVNIKTPFDPSDFIKNLISHRKKPINKTIKEGMEYSSCEYNQNVIKIYNKGLQQGPQGSFILRIEAKYLKMQKLFKNGLKWSEIRKPETWEYLGTVLQKKFSEVIFYDPSIKLKQIPESDRLIIEKGHNPIFWENLSGPHVSRIRKQYQNLIQKHGTMFNNLLELLNQEINAVVKSYQFSAIENKTSFQPEITQMVNSYPLLYGNNSPIAINDRICIVTGISISCQKPESKFLCISGIRQLKKTDPEGYEKLRDQRLNSKWLKYPLEVHFREIAHSIRNEFYNPKHNTRQSILKINEDPVLFDQWPLISQDKRQIAGV
jgi:hypothetical protein